MRGLIKWRNFGSASSGADDYFQSSHAQALRRRSLLLLTFACLLLPVHGAFAAPTIVIDAGHGGHDIGANDSLVYEKHINLDVSRRLQRTLREAGYQVVMTRDRDVFIPLSTRAEIANRYRNALFVSVHFNSSWKTKVMGIETFYQGSTSKSFASYVQSQLIRSIGATDRGVKTANFAVLRRTRHPAVLIEGGFVSNDRERSAMMDPKYRQVVADSIARGVMEFARRR